MGKKVWQDGVRGQRALARSFHVSFGFLNGFTSCLSMLYQLDVKAARERRPGEPTVGGFWQNPHVNMPRVCWVVQMNTWLQASSFEARLPWHFSYAWMIVQETMCTSFDSLESDNLQREARE